MYEGTLLLYKEKEKGNPGNTMSCLVKNQEITRGYTRRAVRSAVHGGMVRRLQGTYMADDDKASTGRR